MISGVRTSILVLSIFSAALTACTQNKTANDRAPSADVFANRPINAVPDLYVVTLSQPPILAVATKTSTGWKIPAKAKERILAEQAKFEADLKTIAPDAKIIYHYHMTLNAVAIYSSIDVQAQVMSLPGVQAVNPALEMARPQGLNIMAALAAPSAVNSVNFIGTERAHALGFTGKGMRIGILDTGIDYTHAMLGGSGKKEDYENDDPSKPSALFPNSKVVGGIDLVGTDFNAASPTATLHEPKMDSNPLDEAGHGSHVAGTIAGRGDGVNTYDGVAPDAQLYAIKVFGKEGSTADAVVIAGFEFAADPNGDLNPDDQLDVINMSLGGGFGQPRVLYSEAIKNLSRAGTVVVASAGNSGAVDYIVGAPSTADEALSVAASIDGSDINWKYGAVRFTSQGQAPLLVKAVEGPISKPIAEITQVSGDLVDIGDASEELSDAVKAQLSGKVALILRGKVSFAIKLKRAADAGALGAVVYTNDAKDPFPMGGEGQVAIPAVMVSQALGQKFLEIMKTNAVTIDFKTADKIEEPANVDTITDLSSKGPRSEDNLIKPEIAAPGQNITSAGMG
ncbi:MAG: S8 family serine peptidase, partial [Bdellovibrionales bacterium]